jgi:hypothetical protein
MKTIDARGFLLRRDSAALPFDRHRSDLTSGLKRRIGEKVLAYLAQTSTHAFNRKREAAFARRQCSCVHGRASVDRCRIAPSPGRSRDFSAIAPPVVESSPPARASISLELTT